MSAVKGIGTDLVEITRIAAAIDKHGERFARRILTEPESARIGCSDPRALAKAFAAKEAVAKALGTGFQQGIGWQDIEVSRNALGAPVVTLSGAAAARMLELGGRDVLLSLSDEHTHALAFAVMT
ncbi:MAG: holo-ACP synthase [Halieaceae bacterium]|jgi:holo-[acyl-carrier protein] synthase|nr:holo-ACP synthase [Halieaceae bacterium]